MITVEHLSKQYGPATVVDDVSLQIERDSITVIVGTSGSGKSTLLRMINRLVEPTSGRVPVSYTHLARIALPTSPPMRPWSPAMPCVV